MMDWSAKISIRIEGTILHSIGKVKYLSDSFNKPLRNDRVNKPVFKQNHAVLR